MRAPHIYLAPSLQVDCTAPTAFCLRLVHGTHLRLSRSCLTGVGWLVPVVVGEAEGASVGDVLGNYGPSVEHRHTTEADAMLGALAAGTSFHAAPPPPFRPSVPPPWSCPSSSSSFLVLRLCPFPSTFFFVSIFFVLLLLFFFFLFFSLFSSSFTWPLPLLQLLFPLLLLSLPQSARMTEWLWAMPWECQWAMYSVPVRHQ